MASKGFSLREIFHLVLLRFLAHRLAGRPYAVKGGICLRFFHRSQRLSEDIDLDIGSQVAVKTLQNIVDTILEARAFRSALTTWGLSGLEITKPKQTDTVQRWKVGLMMGEVRLPTKVEFSRRRGTIPFEVGLPTREILDQYRLPGFAAQFYSGLEMIVQKIHALASANRNAARDLFDLHHLMTGLKSDPQEVTQLLESNTLRAALQKVESFSYNDFAEQVLPYVSADTIALYSRPDAFEGIRVETRKFLGVDIP